MKSEAILHTENNRMRELMRKMQLQGCQTCVIQNPMDLLYLTGLPLSAGKLCVHLQEVALFVDGRYLQAAYDTVPLNVALDEKEAVSAFFRTHSCKTVYFDGQHTTHDTFLKWTEMLQNVDFVPKTAFFKTLREIKDDQEIVKMKKSAELLWKGFEYIRSLLKVGVTENELVLRFEIFCLQNGAEGLAFEPIIAFGQNSAMPHYRPSRSHDVALCPGDIVLIDIGVVVDQYRSDMTRVVFFQDFDPDLKKLYQINKAAHHAALQLCRPGVKLGLLDRAARDVMAEHGVEHLFLHSLGHGIGLETHEYPRIKWDGEDKDVVLKPGMVFTVEPGLYCPGKGGVRYEDTILITETGYENFYPDDGRNT